jgi:hypothetical protein
MATKIQLRRGTAAEWTSANPTLAQGEIGVETDTKMFKLGDGSTAWATLNYVASPGPTSVSANRDLAYTDHGKTLVCTAGITLTIPTGLPAGFSCAIVQSSASAVTISTSGGATLNNVSGHTKTASQYAAVGIVNIGTNAYLLTGATGV